MSWSTSAKCMETKLSGSGLSGFARHRAARSRHSQYTPLRHCHDVPSSHVQIRQSAGDEEPQLVFFASPRYRTLENPKIRLITKITCSTLARTFDFVRFLARSSSRRADADALWFG
jgi:hypothetical protein